MTSRVRTFALSIVKATLEDGRWANKLVPYFRARLKDKDRPLLAELVYGTVKMKMALDFSIMTYLRRYTLDDLTPWIRSLLRLATYQILYLERIPDYAVISDAVDQAKRFGHPGVARLANAVLRRISENRPTSPDPWVRYSHPLWLFRRWEKSLGEEGAIRRMEHNNSPPSLYIRTNTLRVKREELLELVTKSGGGGEALKFPPETIKMALPPEEISLPAELYFSQDLSSQVIPHLLSPKRGCFFYDGAVAPGGKASHLYSILGGDVLLLGVDKTLSRLRATQEVFRRMGLENYLLVLGDSSRLAFLKKPDYTLVDVPCSGLGTLRRRAELRWRMREERIAYLAKLQEEMLEGVSRNIRKGGILVYSTCTTESEENEAQIERFLKRHPEFILEDAGQFLPQCFSRDGFLWVDGTSWDCDFSFAARLRRD